jgi:hypothetical protein
MTASLKWDHQLNQVDQSLNQIHGICANRPDPVSTASTIRSRDQIDQLLAQISIDADRIVQRTKKIQKSFKSSFALNWWIKQFALKVKFLSMEYVGLQNRKMWLKLLQARFASAKKEESMDLQIRHLVDLAVRKRELSELEMLLKSQLQNIARDRQALKLEYKKIAAADENWFASGSMQSRLGVNLTHAKENPSVIALSECLRILSVPGVNPEVGTWLKSTNQDLQKKSSHLADQCRDIATSLAQNGRADKNLAHKFKLTMEQVVAMNEQILTRFAQLKSRPKYHARPKLVQKLEKKDKTTV